MTSELAQKADMFIARMCDGKTKPKPYNQGRPPRVSRQGPILIRDLLRMTKEIKSMEPWKILKNKFSQINVSCYLFVVLACCSLQ